MVLLYLYCVRIAINTRWLLPGKLEGTGIYTLEMLRVLVGQFPDVEFHLLYDRKSAAHFPLIDGKNVFHRVVYPPARHPWLWWWWNDIAVPIALKKIRPDVYWSPDGLRARTTVPQWLTVHDLNFEHHPEWVPPQVGQYYRKYIREGASTAARIFTVSHWSARDIAKTYNIDNHKIKVTYNGTQRAFSPAPEWRPEPYICAVGALTPRKNLITLLRAFSRWLSVEEGRRNFHLKIAGEPHFKDSKFEEEVRNLPHFDRVIWMGRLSADDLQSLYRGATAFCMPSAMEGFGIPVIEALQCGTRVLVANNSALAEVAGNVGVLLPTYDVDAWAWALEESAREEWDCSGAERGSERVGGTDAEHGAERVGGTDSERGSERVGGTDAERGSERARAKRAERVQWSRRFSWERGAQEIVEEIGQLKKQLES